MVKEKYKGIQEENASLKASIENLIKINDKLSGSLKKKIQLKSKKDSQSKLNTSQRSNRFTDQTAFSQMPS